MKLTIPFKYAVEVVKKGSRKETTVFHRGDYDANILELLDAECPIAARWNDFNPGSGRSTPRELRFDGKYFFTPVRNELNEDPAPITVAEFIKSLTTGSGVEQKMFKSLSLDTLERFDPREYARVVSNFEGDARFAMDLRCGELIIVEGTIWRQTPEPHLVLGSFHQFPFDHPYPRVLLGISRDPLGTFSLNEHDLAYDYFSRCPGIPHSAEGIRKRMAIDVAMPEVFSFNNSLDALKEAVAEVLKKGAVDIYDADDKWNRWQGMKVVFDHHLKDRDRSKMDDSAVSGLCEDALSYSRDYLDDEIEYRLSLAVNRYAGSSIPLEFVDAREDDERDADMLEVPVRDSRSDAFEALGRLIAEIIRIGKLHLEYDSRGKPPEHVLSELVDLQEGVLLCRKREEVNDAHFEELCSVALSYSRKYLADRDDLIVRLERCFERYLSTTETSSHAEQTSPDPDGLFRNLRSAIHKVVLSGNGGMNGYEGERWNRHGSILSDFFRLIDGKTASDADVEKVIGLCGSALSFSRDYLDENFTRHLALCIEQYAFSQWSPDFDLGELEGETPSLAR